MGLLQVPAEAGIEHRGATLPTSALCDFVDLELSNLRDLIGDEVDSAASCVTNNKLAPYLQRGRAQSLEGIECCCFLHAS